MAEHLAGLGGVAVEQVDGDPGLGVGERDVVRDDVVQVAGDPDAFVGDPAAGLLLAGALGPFGALLDGGQVGAAGADGVADGAGQQDPGDEADPGADRGAGLGDERGAGEHHGRDGGGDARGGAVGVDREDVERDDQRSDQSGVELGRGEADGQGAGEGDPEQRAGVAAVEEHGGAGDHGQGERGRVGRQVVAEAVDGGGAGGGGEHAEHQQCVEQAGVAAADAARPGVGHARFSTGPDGSAGGAGVGAGAVRRVLRMQYPVMRFDYGSAVFRQCFVSGVRPRFVPF